MFNHSEFISKNKSMIIAPAGYGKTYTIAECLDYTPIYEKQLILTHTHAGVASIKEKIRKRGISSSKYHVETITSFAQKYVLAFYVSSIIPSQDKSSEYYSFIIEKATILFRYNSIKKIIRQTYNGLFVDEYQDCTKAQHNLILSLSEILPVHILGDPLQGIMNFDGDLVNFDEDLRDFEITSELKIPYRWYNEENNQKLGDALKEIREILSGKGNHVIDLSKYDKEIVTTVLIEDRDIYDSSSTYRKCLQKLVTNPQSNPVFESLLLLVPEYQDGKEFKGTIYDRAKLRNLIDYSRRIGLIEAIDDKSFYSIANKIDVVIETIQNKRFKIKFICEDILKHFFDSTCITDWFDIDNNRLIQKRAPLNVKFENLQICIGQFLTCPSTNSFYNLLHFLRYDLNFRCKREGLLSSVFKSLLNSRSDKISVFESMINNRNIMRRVGRRVIGKCIGTTALTKGLEFDTVAILGAHNYSCSKNLYVALTRASKMLIIFTNSNKLEVN